MKTKTLMALLTSAALLAPALAQAACFDQAKPWTVRLGGHNIDPVGGTSHTTIGDIDVDSKLAVTFNIDYRICRNLQADLLLALPVTQDIRLNGGQIGSTQHLPPTLTLQYHPLPDAQFDPYLGVGLNYTRFFNESLDPAGLSLHLKNTFGPAGRAGVDYHLSAHWIAGVDLRYMQIEPKAYVNGGYIGKVKINPLAYGVQVGYRF